MIQAGAKEKFKYSLMAGIFFVFTFLGFGTLELYIGNKDEFWFPYTEMLPILALLGILAIGICITILMLLPDKLFKYGAALLLGTALVLYIQGNFLPNNYGLLDGDTIAWGNYKRRFVYNSIIWIFFISGALLFVRKKEKAFFSAAKVLFGIVLATQVVTLLVAGVTSFVNHPKKHDTSILSTEGEFDVSKKNNTLVFLLDRFDSGLFCELLEQSSGEIEDNFKDFTFYRNVVGGATSTKYAIPYIFTGSANIGNDSYSEYLEKSFSASSLMKELNAQTYDARIYTEAAYIDMGQTDAIDNIVNDSLQATSAWGLTKDFLKLTAFRYAPHALKRYFWMYSGDFDRWKESAGERDAYVADDIAFYNQMLDEGVKCSVDDDVFRFYHLIGAHGPFSMNENCEKVDYEQGNEQDQALGSLKIVMEFINQLKEIGVYENATIFIMADHGGRGIDQNPLFMVKANGIQSKFIQSEVPISYKDFPDMVIQALRKKNIDIEKDYICTSDRYFYVDDDDNNKNRVVEYVIQGAAYDMDKISLTGNVYESNISNGTYKYRLGEKLSFMQDATANTYCKSGFSKNEASHTWTDGNTAEMQFELEGEYNNLMLNMEYTVFSPPQNVQIYVNENRIVDYNVQGYEEKTVLIPRKYVKDNVVDLKFVFPDAVSPKDLGQSGDMRKLALCMQTLSISSTNETNKYQLGKELSFMQDATANTYCKSGFSKNEVTHTWTDGNVAEMHFELEGEYSNNLMLNMEYSAFLPPQNVQIYVNENKIADFDAQGYEEKSVPISRDYVKDNVVELKFVLSDAVSPKELGQSDDPRKLTLCMYTLSISSEEYRRTACKE